MKTLKKYAQIQVIDGSQYEFQPQHLFCETCWELSELAFELASSFGNGSAKQFETDHAISITKNS
jgi:hypothetical protein